MHKFFLAVSAALVSAAVAIHMKALAFGRWVHAREYSLKMKATDTARVILHAAERAMTEARTAERAALNKMMTFCDQAAAEKAKYTA